MKRLIWAAAALDQEVTHMVKGCEASVRPDSVGIEQLVDKTVRLGQRAGAAQPGRKVLSLIHAIAAG